MLSQEEIMEAANHAMQLHSSFNYGKIGASRNEIRIAVNKLGGDEEDDNLVMYTCLKLLSKGTYPENS